MTPARILPRLRVRVTDREAGTVVETSLRSFARNNRDADEVLEALRSAAEAPGRVVRCGGGASPAVEIQAFRPNPIRLSAKGRAELLAIGGARGMIAAILRETDRQPDVVYQLGRRVEVVAVDRVRGLCLACGRALGESDRCLPCALDGSPVRP